MHEGGILHRGWVDLETRIRPKEQHEIIQNCIAGREGTLKHYGHVLGEELPDDVRAAVVAQQPAVERDLASLRDALSNHRAQHA